MRRRHLAAALALAALAPALACGGCGSCGEKPPPDQQSVLRVADPYPGLPPRASQPDWDRAVRVLEEVGADAGYGAVPANVLRLHRGEGWAHRLALLLAYGGTRQLQLAHKDLVDTFTAASQLPADVRYKAKLSEVRIADRAADNEPEPVTRQALLAEIAWCLYALGAATADSGY